MSILKDKERKICQEIAIKHKLPVAKVIEMVEFQITETARLLQEGEVDCIKLDCIGKFNKK